MSLDPKLFGKVAVLMGGHTEREVSLNSGRQVLTALQSVGIDAHSIDVADDLLEQLIAFKPDRVFNILHGGDGEGGVVQALLDALKIPYPDSDPVASALAMDKVRSKRVFASLGLPTANFIVANNAVEVRAFAKDHGLPLVIKPAMDGSSMGVSIVREDMDIDAAFDLAKEQNGPVLVEQFIDGDDLTVGVLHNEALPVIKIKAAVNFYDYHAKYHAEDTEFLCPAGLSAEQELATQELALKAFHALGCRNWGRVDLMQDKAGALWLLEVNTLPGMTDHSLVPKAAKSIGINFQELVVKILASTLS